MALELIDCLSKLNNEKSKNDDSDRIYLELLFQINF